MIEDRFETGADNPLQSDNWRGRYSLHPLPRGDVHGYHTLNPCSMRYRGK